MSLKFINSEIEFNSLVLESKDIFCVVYFYAEWCGPCKAFANKYEEISSKQPEDVKMFKLDIDIVDSVPANYGVMSIPTIIAFKNGEEIGREIGVPSDLENWIKSIK